MLRILTWGIHILARICHIRQKPPFRVAVRAVHKMETRNKNVALSTVGVFLVGFLLAANFTFAAVQGDFGLFKRMQIEAQEETLERELDRLKLEVQLARNKTRRMSDGYLDLDLLDEQARKVLGLARGDEIIIR